MQRPRRRSRRAVLVGGAPLLAGGLSVLAGCNARSGGDSVDASEVTPATVPESGRERLFDIYTADLPPYDPPTLVGDEHFRSRFDWLESLVETVDDYLESTEHAGTPKETNTDPSSAPAEDSPAQTSTEGTTPQTTTSQTTTEETTTDPGGQRGGRGPSRSEVRAEARRLARDVAGLLDRANGAPDRWNMPEDGAVSGRLLAIRGANH